MPKIQLVLYKGILHFPFQKALCILLWIFEMLPLVFRLIRACYPPLIPLALMPFSPFFPSPPPPPFLPPPQPHLPCTVPPSFRRTISIWLSCFLPAASSSHSCSCWRPPVAGCYQPALNWWTLRRNDVSGMEERAQSRVWLEPRGEQLGTANREW